MTPARLLLEQAGIPPETARILTDLNDVLEAIEARAERNSKACTVTPSRP